VQQQHQQLGHWQQHRQHKQQEKQQVQVRWQQQRQKARCHFPSQHKALLTQHLQAGEG
jgi:hypothetical protein